MNNTKMFIGAMVIAILLIPMRDAAFAEEPKTVQKEPQASDGDDKYGALLKDFEALKRDRDNVLAQAKRLLEGKNKLAEMEELRTKWQSENQALNEKNIAIEAANKKFEMEIEQFKSAQESLTQEVSALRKDNEALQEGTKVSEMKSVIVELQKNHGNEIIDLQRKFEPLRKYLQEAEKEIAKQNKAKEEAAKKNQAAIDKLKQENEKAKFRIDELNRSAAEDGKKIKEAMGKNKALGRELRNIPKKFAEIARQNKQLIRETSEMHYNLGVFYTKNQEYDRAVNEFEKSVDINSDNAYAYFNIGYIYAEYLVNRKKAIENFRHYLQVSKGSDKDVNWVKKYLLTWDTYDGKDPID